MAEVHHIAGPLHGLIHSFGPEAYIYPDGYQEVRRTIALPDTGIWGEEDKLYLCHNSVPRHPDNEQQNALTAYFKELQENNSQD